MSKPSVPEHLGCDSTLQLKTIMTKRKKAGILLAAEPQGKQIVVGGYANLGHLKSLHRCITKERP